MPSVSELVALLASHTRPDRAAGWDPVGLQLGDGSALVRRVGVCHEVTLSVVDQAESDGVDLLITYHPLLFRPTTRLVAGTDASGRAFRLIRAGVGLISTHTDFDVAPGGAADSLASAIGLAEVSGFGPLNPAESYKVVVFVPVDEADSVADAMSAAGGGRIGNYTNCSFRTEGIGSFLPEIGSRPAVGAVGATSEEPEIRLEMLASASAVDAVVAALMDAHSYDEPAFDVYRVVSNQGLLGRVGTFGGTLRELAEIVEDRLGGDALRVAGDLDERCPRVAVVPGSGSSYVPAAVRAGATAIVTGDVDHHTAMDASTRGLAIVDPGHSATERPGMAALRDLVAGFGVETVSLGEVVANPWRKV